MIKVTDIEKIEIEKADFAALERAIDAQIIERHRDDPWEAATLEIDLPMSVRTIIAKKYHDEGGWNYVYHVTSEENGERRGLTEFIFSTKPLPKDVTKNMHVITD